MTNSKLPATGLAHDLAAKQEVIDLHHRDGVVHVETLENGPRRIRVESAKQDLFIEVEACETGYSVDLIRQILEVKGIGYVCDEILRDESPTYVQPSLRLDMLGYLAEECFRDKSILDFGCGCGASSVILARMFPTARIVGVELEKEFVSVAVMRKEHYRLNNVEFHLSPDPESLPGELGDFDYVLLSGVYEHLLPDERRSLLPLLWRRLKAGGVFFLSGTPNRQSPIEAHTTHLPLLNYLPRGLVLPLARRFSNRVEADVTWEVLLRRGIRGGTEREIMGILSRAGGKPVLLSPNRLGCKNRIDLWFARSSTARLRRVKKLMAFFLNAIRVTTGVTFTPNLALAIRKAG